MAEHKIITRRTVRRSCRRRKRATADGLIIGQLWRHRNVYIGRLQERAKWEKKMRRNRKWRMMDNNHKQRSQDMVPFRNYRFYFYFLFFVFFYITDVYFATAHRLRAKTNATIKNFTVFLATRLHTTSLSKTKIPFKLDIYVSYYLYSKN